MLLNHFNRAIDSPCATLGDEEGNKAKHNSDSINSEIKSIIDEIVSEPTGSDPLLSQFMDSQMNQTQEDAINEVSPILSMPSNSRSMSLDKEHANASKVGNAGRWTPEEHRLFLTATRQHGKYWKKISETVKTRTPGQVRTHAVEYYAKLAKGEKRGAGESEDEGASTVVGVGAKAKKKRIDECHTNAGNVENPGRWSAEEQGPFLTADLQHGKDWKKTSESVKTQSSDQVQTHAQKHTKLANSRQNGAESVSSGVGATTSADVNVGRWTDEEHLLFLTAALRHGKDWKSIAEIVKTRTVVQVRTHAQKCLKRWMRQNPLAAQLENEIRNT